MDFELEERILPSIRRSQKLLIYRNGGVDNPETLWSDRVRGRGYQKDGDSRSGPLRGRETSQEQDPRSDRMLGRCYQKDGDLMVRTLARSGDLA